MIYDNPILAAKQRDAAAKAVSMPQPVVLVSSLDDQAQFAGRPLPARAKSLAKAAEAAGWGVTVRWSIMAIPAGGRVQAAYLRYSVSVRLRAYGVAAYGLWRDPGGWCCGAIRRGMSWPVTAGANDLSALVKG